MLVLRDRGASCNRERKQIQTKKCMDIVYSHYQRLYKPTESMLLGQNHKTSHRCSYKGHGESIYLQRASSPFDSVCNVDMYMLIDR